ncbi:Protein BANP [Larimichthys crocea]|uniref:Uncharacterized protein n=1 Tax=Larimichthys crocea TaxID=215358 RepID=A0ACD3QE18_LARCR|nr:Protein BANP [Larimichthys crocea]
MAQTQRATDWGILSSECVRGVCSAGPRFAVVQLKISMASSGRTIKVVFMEMTATTAYITNTATKSIHQCKTVLRGAQLIAVASADGGATAVEGSPLPPDIQVQYVQLAPVADHTAAVQAAELAPTLQTDIEVKEAIQGAIQGENGEVVQIVTSVAT